NSERFFEAELYRLKARALLMRGCAEGEAESLLDQALRTARGQQARSVELRAATDLARLWMKQGKRGEARDVLESIYGRFSEGFDTRDLAEAKTVRSQLQLCCLASPSSARWRLDSRSPDVIVSQIVGDHRDVRGLYALVPFVQLIGILGRTGAVRSPMIQILVRPVEVVVVVDPDFDERACPLQILFQVVIFRPVICQPIISSHMKLEQPDIVFADRRREHLATIRQRVVHVSGLADLAHVDDSIDPNFLDRIIRMIVVLEQALEVDGIDQGSFAISLAVDLYGLLDEWQSRTGA